MRSLFRAGANFRPLLLPPAGNRFSTSALDLSPVMFGHPSRIANILWKGSAGW